VLLLLCLSGCQWLEIKPGDDEKTIARKKKLLKSYKSKKRFQQMDIKTKEKQDNWQSFLKGKGSKPKQGGHTREHAGGGGVLCYVLAMEGGGVMGRVLWP